MEIFAGAIGALDEYSIWMQVWSTLSISYQLEKCYTFLFLTNTDRLQLLCYTPVLRVVLNSKFNVFNNKTIILLNLVEYGLILANLAYGLVD